MRTKAKAESAALHAGLRKEQMKVESLERTLQQKVTHLPLPLCSSASSSCCCPEHPVDARGVLEIFGLEAVWVLGYFFGFFSVLWGWFGFFFFLGGAEWALLAYVCLFAAVWAGAGDLCSTKV